MINNYLRELVQLNHRVIIPDFGAFLKKDKTATSLENAITFSPFLRFNDGLLEDYLVEKEHITKSVASAQVRQYVQDIKSAIAAQRPFYVDDLGAFYEDERNSVQFLFAETEEEALRKFDEIVSNLTPAPTSSSVPELEVEPPAALPVEVISEVKKKAKKKVVEVAPEEEEKEIAEVEPTTAKNKKKTDVKDMKKRETKDSSAVSKTIINVNVNTEKDEQASAAEKAKQLEVANSSLQRWIEEVEKRKEQQAQEEKKVHEQQAQVTPEDLEAQRRRQEEIEHALAEKKRRDEEEAKYKAEQEAKEREIALTEKGEEEPLTAVWEENVVERRRKSRGVILLGIVLALVVAVAAVLWFWTPISEALGWESECELVNETLVLEPVYPPAPTVVEPVAKPAFVPVVSVQQPGKYYVVVGTFNIQENAKAFCQVLNRMGLVPEIVKTDNDMLAICVGKYNNFDEARVGLARYSQKYGKAWIMY